MYTKTMVLPGTSPAHSSTWRHTQNGLQLHYRSNADRKTTVWNYWPRRSLSYGAPVPEEPRKNLRPSSNVTSRPLARFDRSLAW